VFSAAPVRLRWGRREWELQGWAGPWPVDERWWDPAVAQRAARAQVLLDEPRALLLICAEGIWTVEGVYE
jgi:protein ImuB